jgi:tetratricopeptide (TPR) repeat protein
VGEELSEGADVEGALKACDEAAELLKSGRQEQAQAKYRQAIELNPQCAKAHRGAGVVELSMENYPAAEAHFKRALRCQPNDVKALLGLGAVDWAAGRREEAFQLYLRAAETDSRDPSTILYLVNAAYVLERYKDLEHALRRFLMTDRGNLSIQYCLAGCYFKQKKYTLAAGVVGNMLRADPAHMQALELREEIERIQAGAAAENVHSPAAELEIPAAGGTPNLGEEALSFQHLFRRANSAAAKLRLLEEAKRKKEYAWVVDYAQEIMQSPEASASERVFGSILKAEARGCLGELEEADRLFYSVQEDQTYGYRALSGRGAIAAAWGQWREAKELFESSLAAEPEYDVALAGLGICYENLGQRERAWDLYQHALRSNSENIQALHGIIQLGYVLDRLPQSELALSNYLDIHPVDFSIVYSYAGCLYSQGKTHEAQDQCRKILIFEPEHALALELLDKIREEAQVSGDQRALGAY